MLGAVVVLAGCAAPPPVQRTGGGAPGPTATLAAAVEPDRRESYSVLTAGPCEKRLLGKWTQITQSTPIFRGGSSGARESAVPAGEPVTISYGFYISDKSCTVAGTTTLQPGRRYIVDGARSFDGTVLAVSTGCTLRITDAETRQVVPLLPPVVQPDFTECKAPQ